MKKSAPLAFIAGVLLLTGCGQETKEKLQQAESENSQLTSELQATLATQDSLFALLNEINDGMSQIKDLENIVATPGNLTGDNPSRKNQIRNDMVAIQEALQQRRQKLNELENKVKQISGKNTNLLKTIENMKVQMAQQETEIATLTNQLAAANVQIASLGATVDSLNTSVNTEKTAREAAMTQVKNLSDELNTCYYAVGTKGELKKNNIIQTGFLRKTKILESDFEKNYFTRADKRNLSVIPLHSNKAKVMTNQPQNSYEIVDNGNQKVLRILNPDAFWSLSNFLVIQVD